MSAVSGMTDASARSGRPEAVADTLIDNRALNWIALGLVVLALALGLGTYLYLTGILPLEPDAARARQLLYANIVLLLLMGGIDQYGRPAGLPGHACAGWPGPACT